MSGMISVTFYSFLFCSGAALLAVVYSFLQAPALRQEFRLLAYLNIIICGLSALVHFYYFNTLQAPMEAQAGPAQIVALIEGIPLEVRYGYWLVTTVMLVTMFPLLIGVEHVGTRLVMQLAGADAAMIIAGYFGERARLAAGAVNDTAVILFLVGCGFWLYMIVTLFRVLRDLPGDRLAPSQRDALAYMFFFILLAWTIYPIGFFQAELFGAGGAGVVLREFTFNLGDIVNKIIWGILVITAARRASQVQAA